MSDLLEQLLQRRSAARTSQDAILERAATESRDLSGDEANEYRSQVIAEREANDALEAERDRQLAELGPRRPGRPEAWRRRNRC